MVYVKTIIAVNRCIYLDDLMEFMSKDEAIRTMHLFGAASENEGISKSVLKDWVVRISSYILPRSFRF